MHITPKLGMDIPMFDLSKRFGFSYSVGGNAIAKLSNNFALGFSGAFLTTNRVNEPNFLDNLKTSDGNIIAQNGEFGEVSTTLSGLNMSLMMGKLFPVFGPNPNSGILFMIGSSLLRHKINIQVRENNVPELSRDNRDSYDRLTRGFGINSFIGYSQISNNRRINFIIGFEPTIAFTKSLRGFNVDTAMFDNEDRIDGLLSFRTGWTIAIYEKRRTVR
jgi:hypothetical protein